MLPSGPGEGDLDLDLDGNRLTGGGLWARPASFLGFACRLLTGTAKTLATAVVFGPHVDVRALRGENSHESTVVTVTNGLQTHAVVPPLARPHTSARGRRVATATRAAPDNDLEGERLSVERPLKDGARAARHGWERKGGNGLGKQRAGKATL